MPSLLDPTDRETILQRLGRLTPSHKPKWGTLTAPRLLCHLADQLRVAVGDLPTVHRDSFLSRTLLKWVVVYSPLRAPPGKVHTAPEMLTSVPTSWNADLQACETLIGRLAATPTAAFQPMFGPLSHNGWGRLCWKHLDHHLRQFGV